MMNSECNLYWWFSALGDDAESDMTQKMSMLKMVDEFRGLDIRMLNESVVTLAT